jgi:lipoyl(octanoyl) transferase
VRVIDLGHLDYRSAWAQQEQVHADVVAGASEAILLVEHPPVITFGRRAAESARHLVAPEAQLRAMHVDVVESDRGGDITFHGPGQVVAYPIVRLIDHRLSVGAYVKALEHAIIDTLAAFDVQGELDPSAIGVWTPSACGPAKVCALGVRIKRGVSLHGVALNVSTDLRYFELIVPCGLTGRPVTSLRQTLGDAAPTLEQVKPVLAAKIAARLS